jgi:hypothetical protein
MKENFTISFSPCVIYVIYKYILFSNTFHSCHNSPTHQMSRALFPEEATVLCDWNGQQISKHALDKLQPGCIVRCVIANTSVERRSLEAVYFKIIKVKDGTFWGKTLDIYRIDHDYIGLPTNTIFTFRKNHIMEIPITWQPSYIRKHLSKYLMQ